MADAFPILLFEKVFDWEKWLEENHTNYSGVWLRFAKKNSGIESISYQEALDVALSFGWIDSQVRKYDDKIYVQKFTPRRPKSIWSKINTKRIAELIKEGKMKPTGLQVVEAAKKDGRWDQAYDPASTIQIPNDFLNALKKDAKAYEFYQTLNKANTYAIAWRLQTAKESETRERRIKQILLMLSNEEKFH